MIPSYWRPFGKYFQAIMDSYSSSCITCFSNRLQVLKQVLGHMTKINKASILWYKTTMHQLIAIKIRVQNYTYPLWET